MSDPVTNVEIEDVLSSIRRLVSESSRAPSPKPVPEIVRDHTEPDSVATAADRLVLTPSLRVEEAEETPPEVLFRHADLDEAAAVETGDYRDESDWDVDEVAFDPKDSAAEMLDDAQEATSKSVESASLDISSGGIALERAQQLDSRIVHWEHISETAEAPYEPDEAGDSEYAGTDVEPLSWEEAEAIELEEEPDFEDAAQDHAPGLDAPELTESEFEPENDVMDRLAGKLETAAKEYVHETVETTVVPEMDFDGADSDETLMLDEAMLRDMVSDIVRQELQGALGERITRNVRKLVRREIHRALAAHELG